MAAETSIFERNLHIEGTVCVQQRIGDRVANAVTWTACIGMTKLALVLSGRGASASMVAAVPHIGSAGSV